MRRRCRGQGDHRSGNRSLAGLRLRDVRRRASAGRAVEELNGSTLDGRTIRVDAANDRPRNDRAVGGGGGTAGKPRVSNDFESLGVGGTFRRALRDKGYTQPTPIQSQAIPQLLQGKDLLGVAQTGTGKTAAFALPLLQRLDEENSPPKPRRPRALVLAPTRELALQIHEELTSLGKYTKLRHAFIIGGVSQNPQIRGLARGSTCSSRRPAASWTLAGQRHVDLSEVSVLVLDEADRLLDMGFVRDVKRIVAQTPKSRQSLLFSATMPKEVAALARELLKDPVRVDVSPKAGDRQRDRPAGRHGRQQRQTADARASLARRRGVSSHRVHTHQARCEQGGPQARERRHRCRGHSRQQVTERSSAGAPELQKWGRLGAGRDRHRRARHRHRRRLPCVQLRAAARTGELRAPHRPNGPRGSDGGCLVARRSIGAQPAASRGKADQVSRPQRSRWICPHAIPPSFAKPTDVRPRTRANHRPISDPVRARRSGRRRRQPAA